MKDQFPASYKPDTTLDWAGPFPRSAVTPPKLGNDAHAAHEPEVPMGKELDH